MLVSIRLCLDFRHCITRESPYVEMAPDHAAGWVATCETPLYTFRVEGFRYRFEDSPTLCRRWYRSLEVFTV